MFKNKSFILIVVLLLFAVFLVATGWTDSDWQMVSYRYSEWHRTVEFWEYSPYLKVNWWLAWQIDLARLLMGSLILGYLIREVQARFKQ